MPSDRGASRPGKGDGMTSTTGPAAAARAMDAATGKTLYIGNQTAFSAQDPEAPFAFALAHGFDAFEWFSDKKAYEDGACSGWDFDDMDEARRVAVRALAEDRGMRLTVHAPWQANPLEPGGHEALIRSIDFAAAVGADPMNLHLYAEAGPERYAETLAPVLEHAAGLGVRLSLENTPHTTPGDVNAIFAALRARGHDDPDRLGLCLDIGHANVCAATRNDYIRFIDELDEAVPIIHLHVHENFGDADSHLTLFTGPAAENDAGIRLFAERMRTRKYRGAIILEQWPEPPEPLVAAAERLRAIFDIPTPRIPDPAPDSVPDPSPDPDLADSGRPGVDGPGDGWEGASDAETDRGSVAIPRAHAPGNGGDHWDESRAINAVAMRGDAEAAAPLARAAAEMPTTMAVRILREEPSSGLIHGRPVSDAGGRAGDGSAPNPAVPQDGFLKEIVAMHREVGSWRGRLEWVRDRLCAEGFEGGAERLAALAIYLRFLGTGEAACADEGGHYRPCHHAEAAARIEDALRRLETTENAWLIRKILPWLPSHDDAFTRHEPLTRIRDIAHRNDIPKDLKLDIKHNLQNKLHRCAGPEDLITATRILEAITAPGADYSGEFVREFQVFYEELLEFFNAPALTRRLQRLREAANANDADDHDRPDDPGDGGGGDEIQGVIDAFQRAREGGEPRAVCETLAALRRALQGWSPSRPAVAQQVRLADIALEDFAFGVLSDWVNRLDEPGDLEGWRSFFHALVAALENIGLGAWNRDECAALLSALSAWTAEFDPSDRFGMLRVKASLERARRLAESYAERVEVVLAPRVGELGRALGVAEHAIDIYVEGDIRGNLLFQLSKLLDLGLRAIRKSLELPPWEAVVPGQGVGELAVVESLHELSRGHRSVIALVERAEGDEEVPLCVRGILLAHPIPHLSHLGVRARQARVPFAASDDPAAFDALTTRDGEPVQLTVDAGGIQIDGGHFASSALIHRPIGRVVVPEATTVGDRWVVPVGEIERATCGAKAFGTRRLYELAEESEGLFAAPRSAAIPFGAMERCMAGPSWAKLQGMIKAVANASEWESLLRDLRGLIASAPIPRELIRELRPCFQWPTRLAVRSSANGEDLEELAGAGLYDSEINVGLEQAPAAIGAVWASLWTRRATLSREQAGIPHDRIRMAVLIQEMATPELSFILHTTDPVTRDPAYAQAELAVGLGEVLASANEPGQPYRMRCAADGDPDKTRMEAFANFSRALQPDMLHGIVRQRLDYAEAPLSRDRALAAHLGGRLGRLAAFLAERLAGPQDVEGVLQGDRLVVVQTRPQQGL